MILTSEKPKENLVIKKRHQYNNYIDFGIKNSFYNMGGICNFEDCKNFIDKFYSKLLNKTSISQKVKNS